MDLKALRVRYRETRLDERTVFSHPFSQFKRWFKEVLAAEISEAYAMTLAGIDAEGRPTARIVLMKAFDQHGIVFYTNGGNRKEAELQPGRFVSLLFFWGELERQVRVGGLIERIDDAEADAYFGVRPRTSQIAAWAFMQSMPVAGRAVMVEAFEGAQARFAGVENIPRPPYWNGYRVPPQQVEFWQGRPSRLHDRLLYTLESRDGQPFWEITRLAP